MRVAVPAFVVLSLTAGCSALPSTGPSASQVATHGSEVAVNRDYLIVDLNAAAISAAANYRINPFSQYFAGDKPPPTQTAGVGDVLSIMLFEAGQGGLFASDNGARVQLNASVGSDGYITVPYAGQVKAAGRTPAQLEADIVKALEGKAIQPQAVVLISQNNSQSVVVTGDVSNPGRISLLAGGERVLDVIAKAGGTKDGAHNLRVQLVRGGRVGEIPMQKLVDYPSENVYVMPGDRLYIISDPEIYTIMGASDQTAAIPFERENVTLLEGIARAGGLSSSRADSTGVFIFRYEPDAIARLLRKDYDGRFGPIVPVVYRVNMGQPNAYFYAKSFLLRDKDLIYISEAPAAEFARFVSVLNGLRSTASTANSIDHIIER